MRPVCVIVVFAAVAGLAECRSGAGEAMSPRGVGIESLTVTSPIFESGAPVPVDFTCDGADHSPPLILSAPPASARSLAVVVDDPDAAGGTFTHWIIYNLRPDTLTIAEAADLGPSGAISGTNDFKRLGYSGPCPPRFELHHYRFRVVALDALLRPEPPATREALDAAMNGHVVGLGTLVGVYSH
jgi:Raf kinase inhibitor-like YbhB/YbcL family protein